jgi:hypothetical protein
MEDNGYSRHSVTTGVTIPTLPELKQHMRWYANSSQGRLAKRPTVTSTVNHAERVFKAYSLSSGSEIAYGDRCEIFKVCHRFSPSPDSVADRSIFYG